MASTVLCYAIVFNVINSAVARTPQAAAALAAFAVALSLVDLLAAPAGMCNQWIVARGRDRRSLRVGAGVIAQLVGFITLLFILVGWTPLGRWIVCDLFGAPADLYPGINGAMRVCVIMPLLWTARNAGQAIIMLRRRTQVMSLGVVLRLGWVWAASVVLVRMPGLDGAMIGGVLWISGVCVEAAFLWLAAGRYLRELPPEPANGQVPTPPGVWRFLVPLIMTSFMWALGRPLINAALARTAGPEVSIAAYQVAWHATFLFLSLQADFRQAVVVLWTDRHSLRTLWRFGLTVASVTSALLAVLGLTGGALWFLEDVLGTPAELALIASRLFLVFSPLPLLWVMTELCIGRLLRSGTTSLVVAGKAVNMAAMVLTIFALAALAPGLGPLAGALGLVIGHAAELLTFRLAMRRAAWEPGTEPGPQPIPEAEPEPKPA